MSYIEVNELCAGYDGLEVVHNISFSIEQNEIMGIIGENGCGKTTLIHALGGVIPGSGDVRINGISLKGLGARKLAEKVSFISQRSGISIDLTVLDVVLMGFYPKLRLLEGPDRTMKEKAVEALKTVGLHVDPDQNYQILSEGQKQLVIFARALVMETGFFLFDEPESSLDFQMRYRMFDQIRKEMEVRNLAVIAALHDPQLALNVCDKLLMMKDGAMIAMVDLKRASLEETEECFRQIYGGVSLHRICSRDGKEQIVMLRER